MEDNRCWRCRKNIKPDYAHYAENDAGINAGIAAFEEALKKNNKEYRSSPTRDGHGFNNDANAGRYNEELRSWHGRELWDSLREIE